MSYNSDLAISVVKKQPYFLVIDINNREIL